MEKLQKLPNRIFPGAGTLFYFTFLEAIRSRLFYILLIFTALVMGLIALVSSFSFGVHVKFLKDFSYSLVSIAGLFLTVFVGFDKLINEIEETTIYGVLSRPVGIGSFIAGKFLAVMTIVWINIWFLGLLVYGVLSYFGGKGDPYFLYGLLFLSLKLAILCALVFFLSLATTKALTIPLALFIYLYGHIGGVIKEKIFVSLGSGFAMVFKGLDLIFPNFLFFDLETQVVHQFQIPFPFFGAALLYSLGFVLFFLSLCKILLENRDF